MDTLFIQTVLVLQILVLGVSEVVIEIKLIHYSNGSSKELDGDCCDVLFGPCINKCDNMITVCLDYPGSSTSFTSCPLGSVSTARIYENNDNFNFPTTLPNNVPNPFTKTHSSWQDGFRIKFIVYDYDPRNSNDLVDKLYKNINLTPTPFQDANEWKTTTVQGTRARIEFQYRVQCQEDYYGSTCSVSCVDTDNENGHYTCDDTGNKICNAGWTGDSCDHDINECESQPCVNGGTCEHGIDTYVCNCAENWGGSLCHLLQDACVSAPCANDATCDSDILSDAMSHYTCTCAPGWEGDNCVDEIYECESSPCKNGGVCQDLINSWNCICKNGTSGTECEDIITTVFDETTIATTTQTTIATTTQTTIATTSQTTIATTPQTTIATTTQTTIATTPQTTIATTTQGNQQKTIQNQNAVGEKSQKESDEDDGFSSSLTYSMIALAVLVLLVVLVIILIFRRRKRKFNDAMEVPSDRYPPVMAISNLQLDQATGGSMYATTITPTKKIPFEEDELGSFQNPVYMLTADDLRVRNAEKENMYAECDDINGINPEKENPYVDMSPVSKEAPVNPVTTKAEPNLYFVD